MGVACYKIVYLAPDPFLGTRIAIAAIVKEEPNNPRLAVLDQPLVLSPSWQALVRIGLSDLRDQDTLSIDQLPASMGPCFILGDPRELGLGVPDPVEWLERISRDQY